jgi:hypothetical protein
MIGYRLTKKYVLALIAIAMVTASNHTLTRSEASVQSGVGAASFPAECKPALNISSVQYVGKDDGKDKILVSWNATKPQSTCVSIVEFRVDVKINRKHGNVDSASKTVSGSATNALVEIPRALLETDPVSFDVRLVAKVNGDRQKSLRLTGNGKPSISSASPNPQVATDACDPAVNVTTINFLPAGSGPKDTVGIFWDANVVSGCMRLDSFRARVKLTRIDGGVDTASSDLFQGNARSAKVELPKGVDVHSFEITIESRARAVTGNVIFDAKKIGNF